MSAQIQTEQRAIELKEGDSLMLVTKNEVLVCTIISVRPRQSIQVDMNKAATVELTIDVRLKK